MPFELDSVTQLESLGARTGNPYISIRLDLRTTRTDPTFTLTEHPNNDGTCLRIYAPGINTTTYPFLKTIPDAVSLLESMVDPPARLGEVSPIGKFLRDQVLFGSTSEVEHMRWEAGAEWRSGDGGEAEAES